MTNQQTDELIKTLSLSTKAKKLLRELFKATRKSDLGTPTLNEETVTIEVNKGALKELQQAGLIIHKPNEIIVTLEGQIKAMS